jgi:hypothetical protein
MTDVKTEDLLKTEQDYEKLKELFEHPAISGALDRLEKIHVSTAIESDDTVVREESRVFVKVLRKLRHELTAQQFKAATARQELANRKAKGK